MENNAFSSFDSGRKSLSKEKKRKMGISCLDLNSNIGDVVNKVTVNKDREFVIIGQHRRSTFKIPNEQENRACGMEWLFY